MIVTLTPKTPSVPCVKPWSFEVTQSSHIQQENFLIQLAKEVKTNTRQAKRLRKLIIGTLSVSISLLVLSQPTFASPVDSVDPDLMNTLLTLMVACVGLSMGAAVIALMLAGTWRMFFGGKQSGEWTINIVKGIAQVLAAPVVVALIAGLFTLLFSGLPAFQPITAPIIAWFQR